MATLLSEQEEKVNTIETQAAGVTHDTEGGYAASNSYLTHMQSLISLFRLKHTEVAVQHARSARRKRWYCFFLTLIIILAAVGIGVGVYFGQTHKSSSG